MRLAHLNSHDIAGGAARAAYRLHHGLRASQFDSRMYVKKKNSGDIQVPGPERKFAKSLALLRPSIDKILTAF